MTVNERAELGLHGGPVVPGETNRDPTVALRHLLWIGEATDSGKTSVARALSEKHALQTYHYDLFDRVEPPGHWARSDPIRFPHMHASEVKDRDQMWVDTKPTDLVEAWLQTTPERFQLTVEDLLALPSEPPIVAEGYGLLPELVLPLLTSTRQAIWLVSNEELKRAIYEQRGTGAFADTRDPARARWNHVERDQLLSDYIRERAAELGLNVIEIDDTQSLAVIISLAETHFAPFLRRETEPKQLFGDRSEDAC